MYDRFVSAFLLRTCELRKYVGPCVLFPWYVCNFCSVKLFHMFSDQLQIFDEVVVLSLVSPLELETRQVGNQ